jgi:hypothetical protein
MSFEDLNRLLEGKDAEERGELVIDALGLPIRNGVGESNRPELVAVKYPEHFSIGCVQPTTLDAWWIDSGGYYLSYGNELIALRETARPSVSVFTHISRI